MKTLIKSVVAIATIAAFNATAAIKVADTESSSFDIGGNIVEECKVTSTANGNQLKLDSAEAQAVATVEIWCNTGQSTASTTYRSTNAGFLKNADRAGKDIAYTVSVANSNFALTTEQTINQAADSGVDGATKTETVSITPTVNGLEYAGNYSDTITVTVALN